MNDSFHEDSYVTAAQAIGILGVKRPTLYSYVSRGLVRSVPGDGRRERRYVRADVERLRRRSHARAGHAAVAGGALDWGEPVLDTALTSITEDGPSYRGHLASDLVARAVVFEQAAELLWTGELPPGAPRWRVERLGFRPQGLAALLPRGAAPLSAVRLASAVLVDGGDDARSLIPRLAASLALALDPGRVVASLSQSSVAATVLHALGKRPRPATVRAANAALVASMDHELNPSSFVARVAASAGADVPACTAAALATLSGSRHGGMCDRVEALVAAVGAPARARQLVDERLRRGDGIPGFGHRLYPRGDPRATWLLDVARSLGRPGTRLQALMAIVRAMNDAGHEPPTLDVGLVAVASALDLPAGSAVALFAIGRTAGCIAHALEQARSGQVLRPRARYVGSPRGEASMRSTEAR